MKLMKNLLALHVLDTNDVAMYHADFQHYNKLTNKYGIVLLIRLLL